MFTVRGSYSLTVKALTGSSYCLAGYRVPSPQTQQYCTHTSICGFVSLAALSRVSCSRMALRLLLTLLISCSLRKKKLSPGSCSVAFLFPLPTLFFRTDGESNEKSLHYGFCILLTGVFSLNLKLSIPDFSL